MTKNNKEKKGNGVSWAELVKKVVYTSLGSAALARDVVSDPRVQKEVLGNLLSRAEKTKDDLMDVLAREVTKFLGKVNISEEVTKALKGLVINLNASIDFKERKGSTLHPSVTIHSAEAEKSSKNK